MAGIFISICVILILGVGTLFVFERRLLKTSLLERVVLVFSTGLLMLISIFILLF